MAHDNVQDKNIDSSNSEQSQASSRLRSDALPIDAKATACQMNASNNDAKIDCWVNAAGEWLDELHSAEKSFDKETPEQKASRVDAQRKYADFQSSEHASIAQIYLMEPNRDPKFPEGQAAFSDLIRDRAIQLQNLAGNEKNGSVSSRIDVSGSDFQSHMRAVSQAIKKADGELNSNYKDLQERLSLYGKVGLRDSERAWISFRDAEFKHIDKVYPGKSPEAKVARSEAKLDIIQNRAQQLEKQLEIVSEK